MNSDRRYTGCRSLLLSGLLLAFAGVAHAALIANSAAAYAEPHNDSLTVVFGPTLPVSSAGTVSPGGVASAGGHAEAAYGALHASSEAIVGGDAQARAMGSSVWTDNATLSSSFIGAAIGRGTFNLSGALSSRVGPTSTAAFANSTVGVSVRVDGVTVFLLGAQLLSRNGVIEIDSISVSGSHVSFTPGSLAGAYSFDMAFTLGTPFQLDADLTSETRSFGSSSVDDAEATSNFGSTGYWGGISDVQLTDGTVVRAFSVTSDSGFDWRHAYGAVPPPITAVPEPGTYVLMLAGLASLGRAARRRSRVSTL